MYLFVRMSRGVSSYLWSRRQELLKPVLRLRRLPRWASWFHGCPRPSTMGRWVSVHWALAHRFALSGCTVLYPHRPRERPVAVPGDRDWCLEHSLMRESCKLGRKWQEGFRMIAWGNPKSGVRNSNELAFRQWIRFPIGNTWKFVWQ